LFIDAGEKAGKRSRIRSWGISLVTRGFAKIHLIILLCPVYLYTAHMLEREGKQKYFVAGDEVTKNISKEDLS
jgi:hypothetical protein